MKIFALFFAAIALLGVRATADTPIATLPFTIAASGNYYLASNLSYSGTAGNAITINASDVILDLQGHRLICGAPPSNAAGGIAAVDRNDVVIRNGSILNFKWGIKLLGATTQRAIIEKLIFTSNRETGIWTEGLGVIIRDNTISSTGSGFSSGNLFTGVGGIFSTGAGARIVNNDISDTYRPGSPATAVWCEGGIIQGNRIANTNKGLQATGIELKNKGINIDNCVMGFDVGISTSSTVMSRRNTFYGCSRLVVGGVDGGDNR